MSTITRDEFELYQTAWAFDDYAKYSPGEAMLPLFLDMTKAQRDKFELRKRYLWGTEPKLTVLDAGAGSGKGSIALAAAGFDPYMVDITFDGLVPEAQSFKRRQAVLWRPLDPLPQFDYVYCTDVLEHIPPQLTMLVIARLLEKAKHGLFLTISLVPDEFGFQVGRPLHQTVMPYDWWRDSLSEIGSMIEARDLINTGVYLLGQRLEARHV